MTVKIDRPTVIVAARSGPPGVLGLTVKETRPFPVPPGEPEIVIHGAVDTAVHAHTPPVVTENPDVPPAAGNTWIFGLTVYVHSGPAA
jgi:hypothetical protein